MWDPLLAFRPSQTVPTIASFNRQRKRRKKTFTWCPASRGIVQVKSGQAPPSLPRLTSSQHGRDLPFQSPRGQVKQRPLSVGINPTRAASVKSFQPQSRATLLSSPPEGGRVAGRLAAAAGVWVDAPVVATSAPPPSEVDSNAPRPSEVDNYLTLSFKTCYAESFLHCAERLLCALTANMVASWSSDIMNSTT